MGVYCGRIYNFSQQINFLQLLSHFSEHELGNISINATFRNMTNRNFYNIMCHLFHYSVIRLCIIKNIINIISKYQFNYCSAQ